MKKGALLSSGCASLKSIPVSLTLSSVPANKLVVLEVISNATNAKCSAAYHALARTAKTVGHTQSDDSDINDAMTDSGSELSSSESD